MFGVGGPGHVQTVSRKARLSVCNSDQWMQTESRIHSLKTSKKAQLSFLMQVSLPIKTLHCSSSFFNHWAEFSTSERELTYDLWMKHLVQTPKDWHWNSRTEETSEIPTHSCSHWKSIYEKNEENIFLGACWRSQKLELMIYKAKFSDLETQKVGPWVLSTKRKTYQLCLTRSTQFVQIWRLNLSLCYVHWLNITETKHWKTIHSTSNLIPVLEIGKI